MIRRYEVEVNLTKKIRFTTEQTEKQLNDIFDEAEDYADDSEETAKLHTATHLLHSALMKVLGGEARQRGSNITAERLRFDFGFDRAMTADEIKAITAIIS